MDPDRSGAGFHPHFSPWLADSEQLSRTLVGHHQVIRDFLARLQGVEEGGAANHMLLTGPRGIGKTHVLCLVERYVSRRLAIPEEWTGPSTAWLAVLFTEEEYAGQNSLANFLLNLYSKLEAAAPTEPLWKLPGNLFSQSDHAVTDCCFERLQRLHQERKQRILLVIDNLQKVLEQWAPEDHQRLRSFLSHHHLVVILGSAQTVFQDVMDQKAAFHEFFEIRPLRELSHEEMLDLLSRRFDQDGRQAEFEARRAELERKVPAIELLTGGNPRLVLFFYQIAARSSFVDIERALRNLLEEVREYFVRRLLELPDQPRKILDTLAQMPGPATPTELAAAARLQPALVNAQLRRLKRDHYVRPIKLQRQKATRYDISERLFRIWRQTATVAGRQRFRFLADFLKLYFTPDEVRAMYHHHVQYLRAASGARREEIIRHVDELFYFQAAGDEEIRCGAFSARIESLVKIGELGWAEEEAQYLAAEARKHGDRPSAIAAYREQAAIHMQAGRYPDVLNDIQRLVRLGAPKDAIFASEQLLEKDRSSPEAWTYLGISAGDLGEFTRALDAFQRAVELAKPTAELRTYQAMALNNLGRFQEALHSAEEAVALDSGDARAWEALGAAAGNLGDHARALEAFRRAAAVCGKPCARVFEWQAEALRALGRLEEGLSAFEGAVKLRPGSARLWHERAWRLAELDRFEEALQSVERARQLGTHPRRYHHDRGDLLLLSGRFADALKELDAGLVAAPDDWDLQVDRLVAVGCLGEQGPLMEALPAALARIPIPPALLPSVYDYMHEVALNCLRRGQTQVARGLFAATLGVESWHGSDWFGRQIGSFLRRALDARPRVFLDFISLLAARVTHEDVLKLLDPYLKASDFLQTRNLGILERLFPEVRELVLDIVGRVDPKLREEIKGLT